MFNLYIFTIFMAPLLITPYTVHTYLAYLHMWTTIYLIIHLFCSEHDLE